MKRWMAVAVFLLAFSVSAKAQTVPGGTPHQVTVTWTTPAPVGGSGTIAGYNVYKSITGAAYVKLTTAILSALTYVDTAVAAGQSLAYCVTTVDSKNAESACSAPATGIVPINPNSPAVTLTVQ